jgi:hypothetical protein
MVANMGMVNRSGMISLELRRRLIKESLRMVNMMEKEYMNGKMDVLMKEDG